MQTNTDGVGNKMASPRQDKFKLRQGSRTQTQYQAVGAGGDDGEGADGCKFV